VCVRRGWLYVCVGYCNSPLNNKNIDYHCPFHINHCVNCVIVVLGLILVLVSLLLESCYVYASLPNKWYQSAELKDLRVKEKRIRSLDRRAG
jgi:hypothetical protein